MAGPKTNSKRFVKRYRQGTQRLADLAQKFPERPSPEAVHDLRVAARRVQAMIKVLPKDVRRSKRGREFRAALGSVLKSTSRVRDLDTLIETLQTESTLLPAELLGSLDNERSDLAVLSRSPVLAFSRARAPSLTSSQVGPRNMARRLRKRTNGQLQAVSALLSQVVEDESKIDELHSLRKEVKKLRYVMELGSGTASELGLLAEWQEALGAIHDRDVAIDYLLTSKSKVPQSVVADLRRRRHAKYVELFGVGPQDCARTLPARLSSRLGAHGEMI